MVFLTKERKAKDSVWDDSLCSSRGEDLESGSQFYPGLAHQSSLALGLVWEGIEQFSLAQSWELMFILIHP